ncbi:klaroid protein isoform X3 [Andrena cerasifolii]|uniref:klaroid protein isoform X3 n=1 Tax=Andrena cerasifolii TaxID=2819439 RepID=UPI00403791A9
MLEIVGVNREGLGMDIFQLRGIIFSQSEPHDRRLIMENEQRHYELRSGSRSRSITPLVQSHVVVEPEMVERHYDLRNQSRERSHTPGEIANSRRSGFKTLPTSSGKTHDQSMDTILEAKEEVITPKDSSEHRHRKLENSIATKKVERRSERQKSRREIFTNGQNEIKEDLASQKNDEKCQSIFSCRTFGSDYSSEEGEREEPSSKQNSAHEIYKRAGEWWNVFPKTDYTYSEKSQCRYEIAPGVLAMPNMSRRSIHSDSGTFTSLSQGLSESGIYETASIEEEKERNADNFTAVSVSSKSKGKRKLTQQLMSPVTMIVLWFSKLLEFLKLKTVRRREYHASDECERRESKWYNVWQHADRCLHRIYLFMVKVFFFDSWLLSRVSNIRRWIQQQKSPKVLWIALLPLLILTGWWCSTYLSTFFLSTKVLTRQIRSASDLLTSDERLLSMEGGFGKAANYFNLITERLDSRINSLEDRTLQQHNRLSNISEALQQLKDSDFVWSKYNNKMLLLEKRLEEHDLVNTYAREIETIKLQFRTLKELYSELKSCCYTHTRAVSNEDLEKRIEMILVEYFGAQLPKKDLVNVIRNLAAASDEKDPPILPDKISTTSSSILTDNRVREIVREALKVYDADKTGRVDYALESAGGQIISTRCTQRYDIKTRVFKLLAFTLYHENNNPRTVIQGNPIQPGACWAFQGFPGYLLIKLRSFIYVTGFTVEHAPKSILPNGEMTSAPRKFNVWGFVDENDPGPVMFGDYEFAASEESLQYFPVQNSAIVAPYEYIELRVHSNHGQLDYTCLYRFRVHGRPV